PGRRPATDPGARRPSTGRRGGRGMSPDGPGPAYDVAALEALALRLDPALLLDDLGLVPDPWQRGLLRSPARRLLLLTCPQAGQSTATAALALHTALFQPGALVLLVSPSLRQSGELFRNVAGSYPAPRRPRGA